MSQRTLRQVYTTIYAGINSKGSCYSLRVYGSYSSYRTAYYYRNSDGSFYYANADGSTYWNDGKGKSRFTRETKTNGPRNMKDAGTKDAMLQHSFQFILNALYRSVKIRSVTVERIISMSPDATRYVTGAIVFSTILS
ncbi:hypothetical protein BU23DRAFT_158554 [Bimuria novae-zelandiae CBS 107.79]|uniref:Uncharacterized protein n=1 Tax=Bimuria novae-zelandiae CBS 107.79 TaxID=1447943 RepID=A0A6A5V5S9_9PLEO|nr:hypothetical protein BU23DRAFT_158554 [Bimuria novae-zelandiae CBS 107.79]